MVREMLSKQGHCRCVTIAAVFIIVTGVNFPGYAQYAVNSSNRVSGEMMPQSSPGWKKATAAMSPGISEQSPEQDGTESGGAASAGNVYGRGIQDIPVNTTAVPQQGKAAGVFSPAPPFTQAGGERKSPQPGGAVMSPGERRESRPRPMDPAFIGKGDNAAGEEEVVAGPQGEESTSSGTGTGTEIEQLIDSYSVTSDIDEARAVLDEIVEIAADDESLQDIVADEFDLTGEALEIWNDFGILVVSVSGGTEFSEEQLEEIYTVLETLPEDAVAEVNVITSMSYLDGADDDTLGFTYSDSDADIIVINTSSSYFSASDGLQTLAETLCHEIGHRVQFSLSDEEQDEFYQLHLASGDDVDNYARAYGMTTYGSDDIGYEDFATMYEAWCTDSSAILAKANSLASSGSTVLLEKVKFIAGLFAHTGDDGQTYTYIFEIGSDGTITGTEVLLGSDGLPEL